MAAQQAMDEIVKQGILPLYFNADETVSVEVLRALYRAGIKAVEYTNRGETALHNFTQLVRVRNQEMQGLLLGVGTIKNLTDAKSYLAAGADFLVSPGFVPEVAQLAQEQDVFYGPGCMTPTEIIAAESAGIRFIKLFPGDMLGPKYVTAIKDIFPKLLFMPTGGVDTTPENIAGWFKAGVCAVGMGSKLVSKQLMADKDYLTIEQATAEVLKTILLIKN